MSLPLHTLPNVLKDSFISSITSVATAWTDGTLEHSSHTRVKEIHLSPKFRLQMQILIAKYYIFKKVICLRSLTFIPAKDNKSASH